MSPPRRAVRHLDQVPHHGRTRHAERIVLGVALLVPLAVVVLFMDLVPGLGFGSAAQRAQADAGVVAKRPVVTANEPPPTLAPPTLVPTATAVPVATATPLPKSAYTVQPGDELRQIAARYGVSIGQIIDANEIPNPDSLRVGQILRIPDR